MPTMTGRPAPDSRDYQPNGMPPGMSKYLLRTDARDEWITVITWADSTPAQVVATRDAQRFLSELFPAGTRYVEVFDVAHALATLL